MFMLSYKENEIDNLMYELGNKYVRKESASHSWARGFIFPHVEFACQQTLVLVQTCLDSRVSMSKYHTAILANKSAICDPLRVVKSRGP